MTPTQELATLLLGEPVDAWVRARRVGGASWRDIAADLRDRTNGRINVTHQTLVNWTEESAA